jgi:hypothetical protein
MKTLAEINELNREFWRQQQLVNDQLMKKSMVLKKTFELVKEEDKHEPIYSRKSWDYLLRHSNTEISQEMAARGRKARDVPKGRSAHAFDSRYSNEMSGNYRRHTLVQVKR